MLAVLFYRRDARKAVYLQHGILDSSMGWVITFLFFNIFLLMMCVRWIYSLEIVDGRSFSYILRQTEQITHIPLSF